MTDADLNTSLRSDIAGLGESIARGLSHKAIAEEDSNRYRSSRRSDISASVDGKMQRKIRERAKSTDPGRFRRG